MPPGAKATAKGDLQRLIELDLRFHTHLHQAFGNRALLDVMRGHGVHIRRLMATTLTLADYRRQVWEEHAGILKAIEAGDVERAGALAEAHTTSSAITVIKHLEPTSAEAAASSRGAPRGA